MSKDVTARCERSDGWWAVEVPELPGLFTQARRLDQVAGMVRDAARMLDVKVGEVNVEPVMDEATARLLCELFDAKGEAKAAQERASKIMRETVSMLRSDGLTVRDVAAVTGVSLQRVSALQDA
ncbi:XRE family transcriptional regulator [Bifidobacterium pseudocatenulatum]|uniref:type II toxin-antitoxin system HicB family antitoxin n=1 Tax=Bifidobacterium pseudocatenulatum TaxID=28026 RepID=UPI001159F135|nr:XRE family transcriptional regulator [Bifidobacterium pseudocatenulatum]GDZ43650.1 hypothetical protein MCC02032_00420 [Bifidobacteriaceae bacterium MCC02032]GDZ49673.1 hypothetical protein MCC02034_02090 [Bifidobacteriaceae bacterium MCC02034]GDZ52194.1 hypothetical protein MCC02035_08870 [Bifidobacteriaceae bacterium MCC02035]GDZ55726.1 hypothetical protein MCC01996_04260 [Bifidobacteriaceae bacterium MCC01996]MBX9002802.1 XRE family transcriptional regulator [Bifidobacterium pseudocatenu